MHPLKGYVILKPIKQETKTGIILPKDESDEEATVIAVNSKRLKVGDKVVYNNQACKKYKEYLNHLHQLSESSM
jgi:co-chaperonin GroES (HSP10)